MAAIPSIPLPLEPSPPQEADDKRLWIGNLDSRLTEYHLIKVLQKYGSVKKFDFLFHKAGPLKGQPRGYCFVTYESRSQAEAALEALNGMQAISKKLLVKWANSVPSCQTSGFFKYGSLCSAQEPFSMNTILKDCCNLINLREKEDISAGKKPQLILPGVSLKQEKSNKNLKSQIKAIEAKLKSMQNEGESELERCLTATVKTEELPKVFKPHNRSRPYPQGRRHSIQNR